jgi:hypothetical protein
MAEGGLVSIVMLSRVRMSLSMDPATAFQSAFWTALVDFSFECTSRSASGVSRANIEFLTAIQSLEEIQILRASSVNWQQEKQEFQLSKKTELC